MGRSKVTVVEDKCDRCGAVMNQLEIVVGNEAPAIAEPEMGFVVSIGSGEAKEVVLKYDMICKRCEVVLRNLVDKMGPVKVSRGPSKKKGEEKEKPKDGPPADKQPANTQAPTKDKDNKDKGGAKKKDPSKAK